MSGEEQFRSTLAGLKRDHKVFRRACREPMHEALPGRFQRLSLEVVDRYPWVDHNLRPTYDPLEEPSVALEKLEVAYESIGKARARECAMEPGRELPRVRESLESLLRAMDSRAVEYDGVLVPFERELTHREFYAAVSRGDFRELRRFLIFPHLIYWTFREGAPLLYEGPLEPPSSMLSRPFMDPLYGALNGGLQRLRDCVRFLLAHEEERSALTKRYEVIRTRLFDDLRAFVDDILRPRDRYAAAALSKAIVILKETWSELEDEAFLDEVIHS